MRTDRPLKILVSDPFRREGLEVLERAEGFEVDFKPGAGEEELSRLILPYDGLVIRSASHVTARVVEAAANLKVIGRAGIGVENVDVNAASRRGIVVMNTPTGNAVTTAEHAMALLFAVARKIAQADTSMKAGRWDAKRLQGRELSGKTLGIIGLGNIGRLVAERAKAMRMSVIAYDPAVSLERALELGVTLVSLGSLYKRSDAITVHTPLTSETRGLVDDAAIAKMKPGVLLVNCARGGIFDEQALVAGLESGRIGGVGIDVFTEEPPGQSPLVVHPNVVATPHLGAATLEAQVRMAVEIAQQVTDFLQSGTVVNSVNVPSVPREVAPVLGPYLGLSRRLGQFLAQAEDFEPDAIALELQGEAAELSGAPMVASAVAGLLGKYMEEPVNPVSAPMLAEDRGIDVTEKKSTHKSEYSTMLILTVTAKGGGQYVVAGSLASDRTPRLVRWGVHELDANLEGDILVMKNEDKPGVVGAVGSLLGAAGINISRIQMGRSPSSGEGASLWSLDASLPRELLKRLRALPDVRSAHCVAVR